VVAAEKARGGDLVVIATTNGGAALKLRSALDELKGEYPDFSNVVVQHW